MPHDTTAILIASPWIVGTIAVIAIFVRAARRPVTPPPDPAFARPSAADLALDISDDDLIKEVEGAWLESVWNLPTREPGVGA